MSYIYSYIYDICLELDVCMCARAHVHMCVCARTHVHMCVDKGTVSCETAAVIP